MMIRMVSVVIIGCAAGLAYVSGGLLLPLCVIAIGAVTGMVTART